LAWVGDKGFEEIQLFSNRVQVRPTVKAGEGGGERLFVGEPIFFVEL
jgi:hypothetical protein